jgi:hypothetical protein
MPRLSLLNGQRAKRFDMGEFFGYEAFDLKEALDAFFPIYDR